MIKLNDYIVLNFQVVCRMLFDIAFERLQKTERETGILKPILVST